MSYRDVKDSVFENNKRLLKTRCVYGLEYCCDGTPNMSRFEKGAKVRKKPPCPLRGNKCPVRKAGYIKIT